MAEILVGMIDADLLDNGTRHPNLAQMIMASYCREQRCKVELVYGDKIDTLYEYNLIIISKVFNFTKLDQRIQKLIDTRNRSLSEYNISIVDAVRSCQLYPEKQIIAIGGTGFFEDGGRDQTEIEKMHLMPYYDLYKEYVEERIKNGYRECDYDDYRFYSIGFTTRGCFRKCNFCVNKKYNRVREWSPLESFIDKNRPKIYLWDDNFFAYGKGWEAILSELNRTGKPFQFRQGLDIRLMTEKKAKILSQSHYNGDFIFAFDHIEDKELITNKLRIWRKYYTGITKLYVLCAFDPLHCSVVSTDLESLQVKDIENTFERIRILMTYGCLPYIMRYEDYRTSKFKDLYIQIARWCNQPQFFKKKSFRQFCIANRDYSKNKDKCSSYKAMVDFEKEYPDIAKKYFDLRFDELNQYDKVDSFGRLKTEPCSNCILSHKTWNNLLDNPDSLIKYYLDRTLDICCLNRENSHCLKEFSKESILEKLVKTLLDTPVYHIIEIIEQFPICAIQMEYVPQHSKYSDCTDNLIGKLSNGKKCDYIELGKLLYSSENDVSRQKYGDNHSKVGALMDLTTITTKDRKKIVEISDLGLYVFKNLNNEERNMLYRRLILRIPIIQQAIIQSKSGKKVYLKELIRSSGMSESTVKRRLPNVTELIKEVQSCGEPKVSERLQYIDFTNDEIDC